MAKKNGKVCDVVRCERVTDGRRFCKSHRFDPDRDPATIRKVVPHGRSRTPEYRAYQSMLQRCYNPKASGYGSYGGRGIEVCAYWREGFENFFRDMGIRPSVGHSLDRIDVEKGYGPFNCRWATRQEQAVNRRLDPNNTSGYRGVCWSKSNRSWMSYIVAHGTVVTIGYFHDTEHAAWFRDQYAVALFGEYAPLNFDYCG